MDEGWQYRLAGVTGTAVITAGVIALVNNTVVLSVAAILPVLSRLSADSPRGPELIWEMLTAMAFFVATMVPLYKPRPRRILDTISTCQRRVLLAMVMLAAIGYFDYTYRLPRLTVLLATPILLVVLPTWFVWIRRRPSRGSRRAIVVGDAPEQIRTVAEETDLPLLGYLAPTSVFGDRRSANVAATDGGLDRLGGLSRIDDIFVDFDVDTAILAFNWADRAEFFGALDACHEHGVAAKVHRDHADSVLTSDRGFETFVHVEIEPWDIQDYLVKRLFDVAFSAVGLVAAAPLMVLIAFAIKLDGGGSVLYRQERTAVFGETFDVWKFRTMEPEGENPKPVDDHENARITRVGRVLRRTHLDELPQLWSILVGDMSVVGPRAVWTEEESLLEEDSAMWRKRWFVKPGLTGLAQVRDVKSTDPEAKLRLDLEYVRCQSFSCDLKIVLRQVWTVGADVLEALTFWRRDES